MINELIVHLTDNEASRNEEWVTEMVKLMIANSTPLMSKEDYEKGFNILFGIFPDLDRNKLFKGKIMEAMKDKLSGSTVYFFEKTRNAIIDERTSANLNITVNSLDPEKEEKKKADRDLLVNRKGIEGIFEQVTKNNGMPPVKITKDDFHGNVEDFDEDGMDEFDDDNVKDFFDSKWGLKMERDLGNPINAYFRINQVTRNYDKWITDILIGLVTCSQVFVDEVEGKVKIEYLRPYEVAVLHSTKGNDEKDSQGFLVRKTTNVRGLLRRFGTSFKLEDNWRHILASISGGVTDGYTGIAENGSIVHGELGRTIDMRQLMDANINYAYTEFRVISENSKQIGVNEHGNLVSLPYDAATQKQDGWNKETKVKEDTYRAYYIDTLANRPKVIKWGKLYMMPTEGVHDEYSGFSIMVNRRHGVPMVNILKPFYHMMQVAFTMFEMLVNDIKPDGYLYNYDSLVKVAEYMYKAKDAPTDVKDAIQQLLVQFQDSPNKITVTPKDDEDKTIGGDAFGIKKVENGLNNAAVDLMKIMDWCEMKAESYLGTQGIEFAEPRDGFKLSLENRRRTRAATQFIDFILLNHLEDIAITLLNYCQDIAKYPDIPAYKYMETLVGTKICKSIGAMKKSPHRHGLVLDTFNNDIQLLELRQYAQQDLANQRITLEQYAFVAKFDNINQAIYYLAQERKKADKKKQKDAMSLLQQQNAMDEAKFRRQLKLEDRKGQWLRLARSEEAKGYTNAAQINANASLAREAMKNEGQDKRLAETAISDVDKIAATANANASAPIKV
jgi:hypothetical protein